MKKITMLLCLMAFACMGAKAQRIDQKDYHGQKDVSVVYFIK